ncbi:tRNA lysidine(34) synthetase TilS [Treponema sp. C6A8]|uniref:tRNA lysidine(34) synthetase TilS n=1 Tax=Treponema sp. C6A8 TaxID=1410609 RepID=UPI000687D456|nr:tRNA lysidine(34) synthetase TilS [Treponema sp. C6A8]
MTEFDNKVFDSLKKLGVDFSADLRLGAAVSGGADSVCLLLSLCAISREYGFKLFVVNVNHNLREAGETDGDSAFVRDLCARLSGAGFDLDFTGEVIPRGKLEKIALERGGGIEDAARSERYRIFESVIESQSLDYLCLAHNQNDLLETALMRFLQGSFTENYAIPAKRGKFLRPLLSISRTEIEGYLRAAGQDWRTDSTNADDSFLRNNIRLNLMPLLDEKFAGWKSSVLNGLEKFAMDADLIGGLADETLSQEELSAGKISLAKFKSFSRALQFRILYRLCNKIDSANRIPFAFFKDILKSLSDGGFSVKTYKNIEISCKNSYITVKKSVKNHTDFTFSVIIEKTGTYQFDFGQLDFSSGVEGDISLSLNQEKLADKLKLPLLLRTFLPGDEIECSDGSMKKVSDVFSSWHVPEEERTRIPVVQEIQSKNQKLCCIIGQVLGFDNWIVK